MRGMTLQSPLRERRSRPEMPAPGAPRSERRSTAGLGAGAVFCLCGLGLSAAVTVIAFFGAGLSLLMQHPSRIGHSAIPPAAIAKHLAVITPPAVPKPVPPSVAAAAASSPLPQAGEAPPPSALPSKAPARPAAPVPASAAPAATNAGPRLPADTATAAAEAPPATVSSPQPQTAVRAKPAIGPMAPLEGRSNLPLSGATPDQPASLALSKAEILLLLDQGDAAFRRGDLAVARLFYQRSIEAGEGRGALGMGATYDPLFLRRYHLWTQRADLVEARTWYRRALELGASNAEPRLDRLKAAAPRQAPVGPRQNGLLDGPPPLRPPQPEALSGGREPNPAQSDR
jgi:hypothetical protein